MKAIESETSLSVDWNLHWKYLVDLVYASLTWSLLDFYFKFIAVMFQVYYSCNRFAHCVSLLLSDILQQEMWCYGLLCLDFTMNYCIVALQNFCHNFMHGLWQMFTYLNCAKKATIHQLTKMLATSKNVLFPAHDHLLTTGANDPSLAGARMVIKVLGHPYWWLAWQLWPGNRTFLEVASMVVTWWIVAFFPVLATLISLVWSMYGMWLFYAMVIFQVYFR